MIANNRMMKRIINCRYLYLMLLPGLLWLILFKYLPMYGIVIAFKDYNKFLNAFKQGKVRQLVVVPGGGRAIARNVQKGRDA